MSETNSGGTSGYQKFPWILTLIFSDRKEFFGLTICFMKVNITHRIQFIFEKEKNP